MASRKPALTVAFAERAAQELNEIWRYNANHRSVLQADRYDAFLKDNIAGLSQTYAEGKPVEGFPELLHMTVRKTRRADGHIVVYQIDDDRQMVVVLHLFHTKMDVPSRLSEDDR